MRVDVETWLARMLERGWPDAMTTSVCNMTTQKMRTRTLVVQAGTKCMHNFKHTRVVLTHPHSKLNRFHSV